MTQGTQVSHFCENRCKEWLPQLKDIPAKELHNWADYYQNYDLKALDYVKPIVDYKEARARSVKMYKKV